MSWASELPAELVCRPMGLVVLTGLDITYNAIHKTIWDSFCNNRRPDRVPLQFKVFQGDHEYPKSRANKRQSYEWYIPKGILKHGWMNKQLNMVPSVVVVFYDLDWDENMWKEKQMECATRVEIVRNSLQGRGTKVAVVLIQKNAPLPPGEDVVAAERAASLCSACDLSAKHLYVLPHTDHLIGYTIRLENAFYEMGQSYYHGEARKVKSHRDFLNKTTHQLLFVRHQFKIAYYNELKQDTHAALKNYKQAYGHLLDLRMHDTNLLEIKTIAGFINYKICRLSFQHNAPLDAIAQFRKHIDFFKSKTGLPELAFEHSAWMSKQFQVFGDLFDEAIKLGLTAIQTQHPGFYYQQASNHAIARKQLCRGRCKPVSNPPQSNPLENLENLDYWGQRPWRQGHQSIDPPDLARERDGIAALQGSEVEVDHSWLIIPLLSSAVAQFKKYKSPRMKRCLMVQMGEEYYHAKDYNRALMLLNKVMWDYRGEQWWALLTSILETSLKCAYLTARVQEYVTNCLELVSNYPQCAAEDKTRIQMNLIHVMSNKSPDPEPGLDSACVDNAKALWADLLKEKNSFSIDMQNIISFVEAKARFTSSTVAADEEIQIEVYVRIRCPYPVRFSKLAVQLSNQIYNQYSEIVDGHGISASSETEGGDGNLYLCPGQPKMYKFSFLPVKEDVGNQLEITGIVLELGCESSMCAVLRWVGGGGDAVAPLQTAESLLPITNKHRTSPVIMWNIVEVNPVTRIVHRPAKLEIELKHQPASLVNEFYLVSFTLVNQEETEITNVSLCFGLHESQGIWEQSTHVCLDKPEFDEDVVVSSLKGIELGALKPKEKVSKKFFIKSLQTGNRTIHAKVTYTVDVQASNKNITCTCQNEETITLSTVTPFDVSFKLLSMKFETIEAVQADELFLLMPELNCTSPWPIQLESSAIDLSAFVKTADEEIVSQLTGVCLKKFESASECICLNPLSCIQPTISLGSYTVHWKRKRDDFLDLPYVSTSVPLPTVKIEHIPMSVELRLSAFGSVKTLLPVVYRLHNKTPYPQEMEVTMEASDTFMFSGNKQIHFRILPGSDYLLTYNLFPLVSGHLMLPRIHVNMLRYPGTMDTIMQKMLPTHIFIKPLGKSLIIPA